MDSLADLIPPMLDGEELDSALCILPSYDADIRNKTKAERLIALQDICRIYVPNGMSREIYAKLYLAFIRSMAKKQTITAVRQSNENSRLIRSESYESIIGGSDSFTIIGESGIGKSSAVSRAVRLLSPSEFINIGDAKIIPCLTVQAPADCSVKGLLFEMLRKTDEILDTKYYQSAVRARATLDILIGTVSQVALNHIGLLIVDEIQNIVNGKNGRSIVGTLTQFINNSGVSICMVGTPEASLFFDSAMMLARRSVGLMYKAPKYDEEYVSFVRLLLSYNYTRNEPQIDDGTYMWLYNHTGGNVAITVGLIRDAEEIAILDGYETIDLTTLKLAYDRRMTMLHAYIDTEGKKLTPPKQAKPEVAETQPIEDDGISIAETAKDAKKKGRDIVLALTAKGVPVEEIEI